MWAWAVRQRWVTLNPTKGVKKPQLGEYRRWPDQAFDDFMSSNIDKNSKLMVAMGLYTAQRLADIVNAKWSDIHFDDGVWTLVQSKTGKHVTVPLLPPLKILLKDSVDLDRSM